MFKTDNKDLFDFSLEQVEEAGWILENHTYDLHHSEYNEGKCHDRIRGEILSQRKSNLPFSSISSCQVKRIA